jgi:hypothetical protein
MSEFERGFHIAAGMCAFAALGAVVLVVGSAVIDLLMDIFGPSWQSRGRPLPEPDPCSVCGWKPAVQIPHVEIVHLSDGTHDTKIKEVY